MPLCLLPIFLPGLILIIQIDGGKLMSSEINELYRRVNYRNNTLIDPLVTSRSILGELVMCQEILVQEAMDTHFDNVIHEQHMKDDPNKVYKSFSDIIEGKDGRFQCGLPHKIIIEFFQTFLIRILKVKFKEKNRLYGKFFKKLCELIQYC
ncbi:DNA-directed RNA polymerase subunit beta' protein [Dioscorea alata]|uniref:DNA-directed RNA polymerase subunit beta' protein n=1 Tax=Dioscorea alata TaxID=55571 RepID=A0ACB7UCN3_DIOAL|nr:DNA-directed RNA polymerase subunit beta' protein [Dioscorea alata]